MDLDNMFDEHDGYSTKVIAIAFEQLETALKDVGLWHSDLTEYGIIATAIRNLYSAHDQQPPELDIKRIRKMSPPVMNHIYVLRLKSLSAKSYNKTAHWQDLRIRALGLAGDECFRCSSCNDLHVHHITYEHLGEEKMSDLQVLCASCHRKEHELYPKLRRPEKAKTSCSL